MTSLSLPIFCSHCPDSVNELGKSLSGQASVSTCPQVPRTYLTLGIVTRTWEVETGTLQEVMTTSLGCIERFCLKLEPTRTHTNRAHTSTHGGEWSFYPQITVQIDFLIVRNTECWGNGSVDEALAAQI